MSIREHAIHKLTHGTQIVSVIGAVKDKLRDDLEHKYKSFRSHIESLESAIDKNTKLIKDLSESI